MSYDVSETKVIPCSCFSVSQIVDYNDAYVLEQEYDAILNNLNLKQMPKDEALLGILSEILNISISLRIFSMR